MEVQKIKPKPGVTKSISYFLIIKLKIGQLKRSLPTSNPKLFYLEPFLYKEVKLIGTLYRLGLVLCLKINTRTKCAGILFYFIKATTTANNATPSIRAAAIIMFV